MADYEGQLYCDVDSVASAAKAGKDILLAVFDATGEALLAVAGQQGLTINRSSDSIEVSSKDTVGGWKSSITGMKEWSIDNDGLYVISSETHKLLGASFEKGDPVCLKVIDGKQKRALFGGLAYITDYSLEAPYDDAMTYSISFSGTGPLVDLTGIPSLDQMPLSMMISEATEAVVLAEIAKTAPTKAAAQALVTALPDGTVKTALQARVTAIEVA